MFDGIYLQTNSLGESKIYQTGFNVLLEAGNTLLSRCLDVRDSSVKPSRTSESTWSLSGTFDPVAKSRKTFSELGDHETSQCGMSRFTNFATCSMCIASQVSLVGSLLFNYLVHHEPCRSDLFV